MKMKEGIFYFLVLAAALVVQTSILPVFFSSLPIPQLVLMLIIAWIIKSGFRRSLFWVVAAGFLFDLISYGSVGQAIIFFVLAAYAADFFSRRFLVGEGKWGVAAAVIFVIAVTIAHRLFWLFLLPIINGGEPLAIPLFFSGLAGEIACNSLFLFLCLFIFRKNEKLLSIREPLTAG